MASESIQSASLLQMSEHGEGESNTEQNKDWMDRLMPDVGLVPPTEWLPEPAS